MWNEEETIRRAVAAACDAGDRLIADGEIGALRHPDHRRRLHRRHRRHRRQDGRRGPRVRVVHHPVNRKLGGSLKTGFAEATGDLILYTDADLPFDMAELSKAVRLLRIYDADIVSAYRFDRTGEGPRRLVYSYAYNHLIQTAVRAAPARHELLLQAVPPLGVRPHRAQERGLVHRRRAAGPGPAPRATRSCSSGSTTSPARRGISTLSSNAVIAHLVTRDARAAQRARVAHAAARRAAATRRPSRGEPCASRAARLPPAASAC